MSNHTPTDYGRFELQSGEDIWEIAKQNVRMDKELRDDPGFFEAQMEDQEPRSEPTTEDTACYCTKGCQVYFGREPFDDCGACGTPFSRDDERYSAAMDAWEDQKIAEFERRRP